MNSSLDNVTELSSSMFQNIQRELTSLESEQFRAWLEKSESKEDLKKRVDGMFSGPKSRIDLYISIFQDKLIALIPEDFDARLLWEQTVLPLVEKTLSKVEDFIVKLVSKIVDFFIAMWNAVKKAFIWVSEKVGPFLADLMEALANITAILNYRSHMA